MIFDVFVETHSPPVKNFVVFFSLIIFPLSSSSQEPTLKTRLVFAVSPGPLLELYHGNSINFGTEFQMNEQYSFYGEYAHYLPIAYVSNNYYQKGRAWSGEVKRYFKPEKSTRKYYISLQYLYGNLTYTRSDPTGYDYYDAANYILYDVEKDFHDISVRYGVLYVHKKRLIINPYAGLGLRMHQVENGLDYNSQELLKNGDLFTPHNWIHDQGRKIYPKIHLGIRIGIRIF